MEGELLGVARWRRRVGARRRGGPATAIEDGSTTGEVEEVDDDKVGAWRSPESTSTTTRLVRASARGGGPPVRADAAGGTQRRSGGGGTTMRWQRHDDARARGGGRLEEAMSSVELGGRSRGDGFIIQAKGTG